MKSSRILLEEKINTFRLLEKGQKTSNRGGEVKFAQKRNSYALNHSFLILENAGLEYLLNGYFNCEEKCHAKQVVVYICLS